MALAGKKEDLVHVPWSSVEEWLEVYKQIYSGNSKEQNKAYETLLVWKARLPKLPVGAECTVGLIQVCLRDREWTQKMNSGELSTLYENDIRMLYSTVIMKFLNHISNIAHKKQTSLFLVAKQLNIPDWIVDLRHNIAHGHELPSIDVMRVVANILLTWLHEEYWAAEAKNLQESSGELDDSKYYNSNDEENLIDLIELWTAIGLYMKTKHVYLVDLPDNEIRNQLQNLFSQLNTSNTSGASFVFDDKSELSTASTMLLSEISKHLNKGDSLLRREKIFIDAVINNEAFLANSEILSIFMEEADENIKNCLPQSLVDFWKDFFLLLQEKKILLNLFLQLIELINREKDTSRKLLASLWVKTIAQAFNKQKIARQVYQTLEQQLDHENEILPAKTLMKKVKTRVDECYPELKNVFWLNISGDFPMCLMDSSFVRRLVLNITEFSEHYMPEILKISAFLDCDSDAKKELLSLMKIHSSVDDNDEMEVENTQGEDKIYTIQDIQEVEKKQAQNPKKIVNSKELGDSKIRNTSWKLASTDGCDWSSCPIGILPWQINDHPTDNPLTVSPSDVSFAIVKNLELPKIVNSKELKLHSKIQWENLLKKNKRSKKKAKQSDIQAQESKNAAGTVS